MISSAPLLAAPRLDFPFKLQVDLSDRGAGAEFLQMDEKVVERPVNFFSKKGSKCTRDTIQSLRRKNWHLLGQVQGWLYI